MPDQDIFGFSPAEAPVAPRSARPTRGGQNNAQSGTFSASAFDLLRIGIASPQDIRSWSRGEVKKPETINYRTFKPERDGLFCERIFGPTKDLECSCGKFKKSKFKGVICDRCGVEVTRAKVRRVRMGHIELAAPVAHLWYVKGVPSPMALLLDMSPRHLERILYFSHWVVTRADQNKISKNIEKIRDAVMAEMVEIDDSRDVERKRAIEAYAETRQRHEEEDETITAADVESARKRAEDVSGDAFAEERKKELQDALGLLAELEKRRLLEDREFRGLQKLMETINRKLGKGFETMFEAGMGADAVKKLLEDIDLESLSRELKKQVQETPVGAQRGRFIKRLEIAEAFRKSKNRPEWMILEVIPVMPPELRPMVQLDGGRFATSDLNDLYRRIINRNNRLKRITEIRAPESIINHEKRLLQESVDALIDNTRRQRPVTGSSGRPLKSLSDMLKGKEGRFRKNLLGKRVDYSGRSVIVVGPYLRLDQCGLPKEMALELFKPFVMKRLVQKGYTQNIKTARRMVERLKPEVWDALEEVITEHPVLLNRAPTLHRLGIQAFEPMLVDGKAIQIHPLVCPSFNADFDGDQMAVHVPLFPAAQAEARVLMMSTNNLFSPRDGAPAMAPAYDMVLGCHYLTIQKQNAKAIAQLTEEEKAALPRYSSADEAILAHDTGNLDLQDLIKVRHWAGEKQREDQANGELITTVGRLIFNEIVPAQLGFHNAPVLKKTIGALIQRCYEEIGNEATVKFLDAVKTLGFRYGTKSGISISMADFRVQTDRTEILEKTEAKVRRTNDIYNDDPLAMTAQERERQVLQAWIGAAKEVGDSVVRAMDSYNPFRMMAFSGARGSERQIQQIVGMRGLMMDPSGRFIEDLPVRSNFREGLDLHEYFVSTHGARKGLADTALRTADAGYLTRRLVDVSQDVIIRADDCGTNDGISVSEVWEETETHMSTAARASIGRRLSDNVKDPESGELLFEQGAYIYSDVADRLKQLPPSTRVHIRTPLQGLADRLVGRISLETVKDPRSGETLIKKGQEIHRHTADKIEQAGVDQVKIRSILTCKLGKGVCAKCYGHDLSTNDMVEIGEAVGIIAAQSIGEPGTQLTMRTFHLGGVAGGASLTGVAQVKKARTQALQELRRDIDQGTFSLQGSATEQKREIQRYLKVLEATVGGLLRVVELFEARKPKGEAITTDVDGTVVAILGGGRAEIMPGFDLKIDQQQARTGVRRVLIQTTEEITDREKLIGHYAAHDIPGAKGAKALATAGQELTDRILDQIEKAGHKRVTVRREFAVPYRGTLAVKVGDEVTTGNMLTRGPLWPQDVLAWRGLKGVSEYLVAEVQKVYKAQSISIHDKHIEVIVRQMLRKRRIKDTGDTELMPGKLVDSGVLEGVNERATSEGLHPATADYVLLGITEAALATESFLSAASFQKTTKVLTEAATHGRVDLLEGLKENVIIGRLIPAGTGMNRKGSVDVKIDEEALAYAESHVDEFQVSNMMARTPGKAEKMPSYDDIYPVPLAIEDTGALDEAGFSVEEGEPDDVDEAAGLDDFLSAGALDDPAELADFGEEV